jgi:F-type H+-transporting ATPase subunit delta
MNTGERVQSYASAFFEAAFEHWLGGLEQLAGVLAENGALRARLQAVDVDFAVRQAALDGVMLAGADPLVRNLLYTLLQRGDLGLLGEIIGALRSRVRRAEAEPIPVEVVTAVPLDDAQRQQLMARLEAQHGAGLAYSYRVDPAILGGMIVRVGDKLIDGSVASKLAAMKQALGVAPGE